MLNGYVNHLYVIKYLTSFRREKVVIWGNEDVFL